MDTMFARHDRVWLSRDGWARAAGERSAHAHVYVQWAERDWPVIVRRPDAGMPPNMVALGMPLPPDIASKKKGRLAFTVREDEIVRREPPLAICDSRPALPSQWRQAHANLCRQAVSEQLELRVYGSLAMQALTGLPYLGEESDIDLLFSPHNRTELDLGLSLLTQYAGQLPLDGEILFPSGRAVAWREWLQARDLGYTMYVLAKSMQTVALIRADELLGELRNDSAQASHNATPDRQPQPSPQKKHEAPYLAQQRQQQSQAHSDVKEI